MTSQINYDDIDEEFPVEGRDNPSSGFRSNFLNIKTAFSSAKSEISDLQLSQNGLQGPMGQQGLPGERGPQGAQGTSGEYAAIGPQGPIGPQGDPGLPYNTIMVPLGDVTNITLSPLLTGINVYTANLIDTGGTITIVPLGAGEYGECLLMLTSSADGTNSITVDLSTNPKWIDGNHLPIEPLNNETVGLYVQSIGGVLYLSLTNWRP